MMNRAVRGKSAPHPVDDVGDVRGAASDQDRHAGRRRERAAGRAQGRDQRLALVAVRAVRRVERERREVAAGRRGEGGLDVAVARPVRVAVEERVLGQRQARIDVDEAVDARDVRIRRQPARVVVERGEVGRGRRGALGPDRQDDRRELALAELAPEPVERRARRHLGRQDRGVGGVEPDVQERRTEQQEEGEGRDQDRDRVTHHPACQARPRPVGAGARSRPSGPRNGRPAGRGASGSRAAGSAPRRPRARPRSRRRSRPSAGS